nr:MAG TPA: hypothetical protein [Caudoviricetes sp.]
MLYPTAKTTNVIRNSYRNCTISCCAILPSR